MQELLDILQCCCSLLDLSCNAKKTVCMKFDPIDRSKIVASKFQQFTLCGSKLQFVSEFRYLGHIITDQLTDDSDIKREVRNMYIRTNILIRRFSRCSTVVKLRLFKSFVLCVYGCALWNNHTKASVNKFSSCYNKCVKMFFGFRRSDSVTDMLSQLVLPSFNTVLHNCRAVFMQQCSTDSNDIINYLRQISVHL
mgnify:FL=1